MPPIKNWDFWIAVAIALIVKIRTSQQLGPWGVLTTLIVAIGAAWIGTDFTAAKLGVPEPIAAALVTLTAEGAMRWLLLSVNDPRVLIQLWKEWWK